MDFLQVGQQFRKAQTDRWKPEPALFHPTAPRGRSAWPYKLQKQRAFKQRPQRPGDDARDRDALLLTATLMLLLGPYAARSVPVPVKTKSQASLLL